MKELMGQCPPPQNFWARTVRVHSAKALARNERPFARDICVVPSIVLDRGPSTPKEREDLGVGTPSSQ